MQGALRQSPLRLPLAPPVILLRGECRLQSYGGVWGEMHVLQWPSSDPGKKEDLVLEKVVPGLAAERVADDELEDVEREVGDQAEEPDDPCPSPSDALNPGKPP